MTMASPPAKRFCAADSQEIAPEPDKTWSEDESLEEAKLEPNPMLNPVVLKHFFGVCQLEDLRRFRLVCPLWTDLSLERWREEMVVHIAFDEYFEERKNSNKRKRLHWEDASILYQTPSIASKPFRKFRLCQWQFPEFKPKRDSLYKRQRRQILNEFWINCGPWMTELHLKEGHIESTGTFRDAVTEFAPNIVLLNLSEISGTSLASLEDLGNSKTQPNLKSLNVVINFDAYDDSEITSNTWFGLLATFTNIQELMWNGASAVQCQNLLLAWNRLVEDEKHAGRKLKIKCYNIRGYDEFETTHIATLAAFFEHPDFAFEYIRTNVKSSAQEEILTRALKSHEKTLKTLDILNTTWKFNLNQLFLVPRLLTRARLKLDATPDFHFLKNLPHLKKLVIMGCRSSIAEATRIEEMEGVQLLKLTEMEFLGGPRGIGYYKPAMDIFVKCMPNLSALSCPLSNEIFRVVCQHLRGLKNIGDYAGCDGILNDEGVTGIIPGEASRLPNITLLKYLQKFETTSSSLTDKSVYDGFLQLDHLTDLDINDNSLSSDAVSALSSKFGSQIFHAQHRYDRYFYDDENEYKDRFVERRLEVQMLAKDYGIILGDESDLYGDEVGCRRDGDN